jgi:hypothetical protein
MRRERLLRGFVLTCCMLSVGCTEILLDGKSYYHEQGKDPEPGDAPVCEQGLTTCGDACVRVDSDSRHCGACGHDCLGASCAAGMCLPEEVVPSIEEPRGLAVDGEYVYWTTAGGQVQRASRDGGEVDVLFDGQPGPRAIAVDQNKAFWVNAGDRTVMKGNKSGNGMLKQVFEGGYGDNLGGLTLDESDVYFSRSALDGDIRRAGKASDAPALPLLGSQSLPAEVGLLGTHVLWAGLEPTGGGYVRCVDPKQPSNVLTLAEGEGEIVALTALGDTAVWADGTFGRIRARGLRDGAAVTLVEDQDVRGLAADSQRIFWSNGNGNVKWHDPSTHETRVLAFDVDSAGLVVTDAEYVYILRTGPNGGVLRVAK